MRRTTDLRDLEPGRVCLIKPSSLGDVVHALPVLAALRQRWPRAHIAWVINRGLVPLIDGHPDLDEIIPFDRSAVRANPKGVLAIGRFLRQLHSRRFDVAIDLQGLLRSGLMAAATGAGVRVGLAEAREGAPRFYSHPIATMPAAVHMVDRMLLVARAFGATTDQPRFQLPADAEADRWAHEALLGAPRPRLTINLGARWLTKRWPPAHFAELAREAYRAVGAGLVALGAAEDRPLVDELRAELGRVPFLDLCGRTDLRQLAAVARQSDVFLSNDTGPLHLAAAAGARTVSVYTCSDVRKTGPYGPDAVAVSTTVWCAASCVKTCDRMECMGELTPERVWPALRRQLERPGDGRSRVA